MASKSKTFVRCLRSSEKQPYPLNKRFSFPRPRSSSCPRGGSYELLRTSVTAVVGSFHVQSYHSLSNRSRRGEGTGTYTACVSAMSCRGFADGTFGDGAGKPNRLPSEVYDYVWRHGRIDKDEHQMPIVRQLDEAVLAMRAYGAPQVKVAESTSASPFSFVTSIFGGVKESKKSLSANTKSPRGLYLWGDPGCGKTFLMDLAYRCAPNKGKKRTHFNSFMMDVHKRIFQWRQSKGDSKDGDPIPPLARALMKEAHILFFDEFQVTDVADAMVVRRLFSELFDMGMVIIATSNRDPKDLYYNGIQRDLFLPFIDLLQVQTEVIHLRSGIDYRKTGTRLTDTYFYPLGPESSTLMAEAFNHITHGVAPKASTVKVGFERTFEVKEHVGGVARFTFAELCKRNVGASDYMALAEQFHTIFITDIPTFTLKDVNVIRRFILLIDELYQHSVRLVASAAEEPLKLFVAEEGHFEEVFAFERCVSRLIEMQSKQYLSKIKPQTAIDSK